ncbi:MAG: formate dehydrogenase subunit alpha [Crenarchaeota archaeon]|nr:formate dehydrogenase subunit alpha [Thermoproteota archaeon]
MAGEIKLGYTVCPFCGAGCAFHLVVKDGVVIGAERIYDHPVSAGVLCPKGAYAWKIINHPDRLKTPLKRTERGFRPITWREALREIAEAMRRIAKDDPNRAYFLSSAKCTNEENFLLQKIARAIIGTNNIDHCARLCHSPTVAALARSLGSAAMTNPINDVANAKTLFIIGYNPAETHPAIFRFIEDARRKYASVPAKKIALARFSLGLQETEFKMIVADPRKTMTAVQADIHLQQKPGTDALLINAMIKTIIDHDLVDKEFIEKRTKGYERLVESLKDFDLDEAARITGVPRKLIEEAAIIYATNKPSTIYYGMGITQHRNGTDLVQALVNMALITGNLGKPGAGICPARGQANVQGACDMAALPDFYPGYRKITPENARELSHIWGLPVPVEEGLFSTEMWNVALTGGIDLLYVMGENPLISEPGYYRIMRALNRIDLVVVQDIFLTETARHADIVLPAGLWAEKTGTMTNTERRVQLFEKIVDPPGEARPDLDILLALLKELGSPFTYDGPEQVFEDIRRTIPTYRGITYERLRKKRYGIQWPCPNENHPGTPILHTERFPTSDGKARIYPVRPEVTVKTTDEYPFILINGRLITHYNTGTMTRRIMELLLKDDSSLLYISPDDARTLGILDGDVVELETPYGRERITVRITTEVPKGVLFVPNHFIDPPVNTFVGDIIDPISGIPEYKGIPARINLI